MGCPGAGAISSTVRTQYLAWNCQCLIRVDLKKLTLTNLYNENPTWLRLLNQKLDCAVLDAYGWPHDLTDDDILARLLAENLKREAA